MAGRALPMALSALAGIVLGSVATMLLTAPPDHRGEMPMAALPQPSAVPDTAAAARPAVAADQEVELAAARQALAARLRSPDALRLQDVRVWQYGPADERAVCGSLFSPEVSGGTARFVVRVLLPRGRPDAGGRPLQTVVEDAPWLVRPSPEAARRFCRAPEPEPPPVPPPAAALTPSGQTGTDAAASTTQAGSPPAPAPLPAVDAQRGGRVVTQSPANLRAAPSGEVLGSVPRGRSLVVFDRAPGGWVQVGETAPQGWIHSSLLGDAPPP